MTGRDVVVVPHEQLAVIAAVGAVNPIGVPGIWFPFGIGVSCSQYIDAIVIPLLALLIVRTLPVFNRLSVRS